MPMPSELKTELISKYHEAANDALGTQLESSYDAGFQAGALSVPGGDPSLIYTQAQVDQFLADAKAALKLSVVGLVQAHDANTQVDADLIASVEAL